MDGEQSFTYFCSETLIGRVLVAPSLDIVERSTCDDKRRNDLIRAFIVRERICPSRGHKFTPADEKTGLVQHLPQRRRHSGESQCGRID